MVVGVLVGIVVIALSAWAVYESAWGSWRRTARFPSTPSSTELDWDALRNGDGRSTTPTATPPTDGTS